MVHEFTERLFGGGGKTLPNYSEKARNGPPSREKNAPLQPNELRNDERGRRQ